jgi:hypothetical protein
VNDKGRYHSLKSDGWKELAAQLENAADMKYYSSCRK